MATRQEITSIGETPTFWNAIKPAVFGIHPYLSSRGLTLSLAPTCFDYRFAEDCEGKYRSFFSFFSSLIVSFSSVSHTFSLLFILFLFSLFAFSFYLFFFTLPTDFFFIPSSERKLPLTLLFILPCVTWTHVLGSTLHSICLSCHVAAPGHDAMWHHAMCHSTPNASKNMKFRSSRNSTR